MISAKLTNETRREVYRRDHWRCALCDDPRRIQIHHLYPRSRGGCDHPMNLITLCSRCHAAIHGFPLPETREYLAGESDAEIQEWAWQGAHEYLADYYAPDWYHWDG